jgi:hypothetical protein
MPRLHCGLTGIVLVGRTSVPSPRLHRGSIAARSPRGSSSCCCRRRRGAYTAAPLRRQADRGRPGRPGAFPRCLRLHCGSGCWLPPFPIHRPDASLRSAFAAAPLRRAQREPSDRRKPAIAAVFRPQVHCGGPKALPPTPPCSRPPGLLARGSIVGSIAARSLRPKPCGPGVSPWCLHRGSIAATSTRRTPWSARLRGADTAAPLRHHRRRALIDSLYVCAVHTPRLHCGMSGRPTARSTSDCLRGTYTAAPLRRGRHH